MQHDKETQRIVITIALLVSALAGSRAAAQMQHWCSHTYPYTSYSIFDAGRSSSDFGVLPPDGIAMPIGSCQQVITFPSLVNSPLTCLEFGGTRYCGYRPDAIRAEGSMELAAVTDFGPAGSISGIRCPGGMALLGVFMTNPPDLASAPPATLDFMESGTSFEDLHPVLNQVFFIGDGRTGSGQGLLQRFHAPEGTARLYLGFAFSPTFSGIPCCHGDLRCVDGCGDFTGVGVIDVDACFAFHSVVYLFRSDSFIPMGRATSDWPPPLLANFQVITYTWWTNRDDNVALFPHQWRKNGVPLLDGRSASGSLIVGAQTDRLWVLDASQADVGAYDCEIQSPCNTIITPPLQGVLCDELFATWNCRSAENIFRFLELWFSGDDRADVDDSGALTVQDIFAFLEAYFSGCPLTC